MGGWGRDLSKRWQCPEPGKQQRGRREVGRFKRQHQWHLMIDWIWGAGEEGWHLTGFLVAENKILLLVKQKGVFSKILGGNTIFGKSRKSSLEGSHRLKIVKRNGRPYHGTVGENDCCFLLGFFCETRNQLPQKSWKPPHLLPQEATFPYLMEGHASRSASCPYEGTNS